eukprot:TRINITY_DN6340_c0_g2_i2.p1 TRINITY_DN6340_c0_g2~~TRINITY_DN6340_c0_g2_i2.p1  ORF type:complete len:495 (-),score=52.08 TRINITY_DN6340_c0_g2_i2:82-1566(-)
MGDLEQLEDRRFKPPSTWKPLGKGGEGAVYLANWRYTIFSLPSASRRRKGTVAIKIYNCNDISREVDAFKMIQQGTPSSSPYIVHVYGYGESDHFKAPFIAMEYVKGGSLDEFIKRDHHHHVENINNGSSNGINSSGRSGGKGDDDNDGDGIGSRVRKDDSNSRGDRTSTSNSYDKLKYMIVRDLCKGVRHLHEKGLVHRDLNPRNLLLCSESTQLSLPTSWNDDDATVHIKICDMGRMRAFDATKMTTNLGTVNYMAPEMFSDDAEGPYNKEVDIYAIGMIMYAIWVGKEPYQGVPFSMIPTKIVTGVRPIIPKGTPLEDLMQRCWHAEPAERPHIDEIIRRVSEKCAPKWSDRAGARLRSGAGDFLSGLLVDLFRELGNLVTYVCFGVIAWVAMMCYSLHNRGSFAWITACMAIFFAILMLAPIVNRKNQHIDTPTFLYHTSIIAILSSNIYCMCLNISTVLMQRMIVLCLGVPAFFILFIRGLYHWATNLK